MLFDNVRCSFIFFIFPKKFFYYYYFILSKTLLQPWAMSPVCFLRQLAELVGPDRMNDNAARAPIFRESAILSRIRVGHTILEFAGDFHGAESPRERRIDSRATGFPSIYRRDIQRPCGDQILNFNR